jgi:hypothetical protein
MQNVITPPSDKSAHFVFPRLPSEPRDHARRPEVPLLPSVLSGPAAFLWLWVLPLAILLALNVQGYALIEGNMGAVERSRALWLGLANAGNLLAGVVLFFVVRIMAARSASPAAQLVVRTAPALAVQIGFLWFAFVSADAIPFSVRSWIYPDSRFLFNQFSFAMLPLFVGMLHLACAQRGAGMGRAVLVNVGIALVAPVGLYLLAQGARTFRPESVFAPTVLATMVIAMGVTMFVGLARALVLGLRRAQQGGNAITEPFIVAVVALGLPFAGLLLNRAIDFPVNFQAWEVYTLTVANAAILFLASWRRPRTPRLSFALLSATLPFSLYFFVVFLPYTPLAVFAVLFFGAGFLLLGPTLLVTLHLYLLNRAYHTMRAERRPRFDAIVGMLCFLILPMALVGRATADRAALNGALRHLYTPSINGSDIVYGRDVAVLRRAVSSHRSYKNGIYYPLISDFYSWWVFDNLVLPDDKLTRIEETFFGTAAAKRSSPVTPNQGGDVLRTRGSVRSRSRMPTAVRLPHAVVVDKLLVQSRAADAANSVVTCALTLHNPGAGADEYVKKLPLPAGVFVVGFRLHVNGVPVPGRIFEKKTAMWVYTMIRDSERRDPGLLFYNRPDELELRVFPIGARQSTVVEIDFLVPAEVKAADLGASRDVAQVLAELGRGLDPQFALDARGAYFSLGEANRARLPLVECEPFLHVIVDRSVDGEFKGDLPAALRRLSERFPTARRARITLANHDIVDLVSELTPIAQLTARDLGEWQRKLRVSGALVSDLALAHAIRRHRELDLDRPARDDGIPPRPVFVILRDGPPLAPDLSLTENWLDLMPDFELHELTAVGGFTTHRKNEYGAVPLMRWGDSVRPLHPTRAVRFAAGANATGVKAWSPMMHAWQPVVAVRAQPAATPWSRAAALMLAQQDYSRSPGDAAIDLSGVVRASRESGVLLSSASYIVVENAAQWQMLERTERQKLSQNAALEVLETPAPPAFYIALAFAGWLVVTRIRRGHSA